MNLFPAPSADPLTVIGLIGAAILIIAYFANQQGWLSAANWRFPFANFVGSALILLSFWSEWNLPAALIEAIWAAISLYGLGRRLLR